MAGRFALFGFIQQHRLTEFIQLFRQQVILGFQHHPFAYLMQPVRQVFAAVAALINAGLAD
ncbi:hypothetical protein D3C80_2228300 [compost metagenome]